MTNDHPAPQDPRAAEARRLREEEGYSLAQIREVFPVGNERLSAWLKGTTPPDWTKRPMAKDEQREAARELRKKGLTYRQIVTELSVSLSSVSLWVRDIEVVREVHPSWTPEARAKRELRKEERQRAKIAARKSNQATRVMELLPFRDRDILITGAIAYWCEGAKWKDWMPNQPGVTFVNSDPALVRLFLRFLKVVPVKFGAVRYRLHIHESASESEAHAFWAHELGIEPGDFSKTTWKTHNPKTVRKNTGETYHGCLAVSVLQCRELYRYLDRVVATSLGALAGHPAQGWSVCGNIRSAPS